MKRRLNENIEIGDEVYIPRDEFTGTVISINGNKVLIDTPFGKEYFNINDLKKLGGDYEEEDLAPPFRKNFMESRKKIIRLTESDLVRIVKRVIRENEDNMINETSLIHRIQYGKQIRDAKKQSKENDECMCVVETRVSGVIVKPCSELTSTEEDHIIYNTDNCDTFDGTY